MSALESHYRRLLRAYPPAYRQAHGEEIIGTLLQASGDRRLPSPVEAAGLIGGGVTARMRAATAHPVAWWADGLHLGVLLIALANLALNLSGRRRRPALAAGRRDRRAGDHRPGRGPHPGVSDVPDDHDGRHRRLLGCRNSPRTGHGPDGPADAAVAQLTSCPWATRCGSSASVGSVAHMSHTGFVAVFYLAQRGPHPDPERCHDDRWEAMT
ncbi:hypothetical protein [Actinomadura sp. DC4]|uniref:hypothetical protein n=1 Tax=Actinomadura sp. DC4 TaxID=3055069 RepID=UPI0025B1A223|nr:hypothetical protein [Actinomadura sp. DC4]MDN3355602.1 hypothetical protein [Actinomadura sp. DC4]